MGIVMVAMGIAMVARNGHSPGSHGSNGHSHGIDTVKPPKEEACQNAADGDKEALQSAAQPPYGEAIQGAADEEAFQSTSSASAPSSGSTLGCTARRCPRSPRRNHSHSGLYGRQPSEDEAPHENEAPHRLRENSRA